MVTKQQQLELIAKECHAWKGSDFILVSDTELGFRIPVTTGWHLITRQEWQQERDKMQKQGGKADSWHERGERPPAWCECEVFDGDDWLQSFIVGHSRSGDVVVQTRTGYFEASHAKFRPLRTEREKAIDALIEIICAGGELSKDGSAAREIAERIYDAGLLK